MSRFKLVPTKEKPTKAIKKPDIWEFLSNTEWVNIKSMAKGRRGPTSNIVNEDEVGVLTNRTGSSGVKLKKTNLANNIRIRIGSKITKDLGWNNGDTIYVGQSPNNDLHFLLARIDSNAGFTLRENKYNRPYSDVIFTWPNKDYALVKLEDFVKIEYMIKKKEKNLILILDESLKPTKYR